MQVQKIPTHKVRSLPIRWCIAISVQCCRPTAWRTMKLPLFARPTSVCPSVSEKLEHCGNGARYAYSIFILSLHHRTFPQTGRWQPRIKITSQIAAKPFQIHRWFVLTVNGNIVPLSSPYQTAPPSTIRGTPPLPKTCRASAALWCLPTLLSTNLPHVDLFELVYMPIAANSFVTLNTRQSLSF